MVEIMFHGHSALTDTLLFKSLGSVRFVMFLSLLDKKYRKKTVILWNIIAISNIGFLFYYALKYNLFLWCSAEFSSAITPDFCVTWYFRNHSDMLIYYQCWNCCAA